MTTQLVPGKLYTFNGLGTGWSLGYISGDDVEYEYKFDIPLVFINKKTTSMPTVFRYYFLHGKTNVFRNVDMKINKAFLSCFKEVK